MKTKSYKNKYSKKVEKNFAKKKKDKMWIMKITILAFCISLIFSLFTESVIPNSHILISIIIVFIFIMLGVIFDMVGISVTASNPKTFNSMATKKVKGAKAGIRLMKQADKVSSFCNDVIGDVCGILSGSAGAAIAISISDMYDVSPFYLSLFITSLIGALTIGGKAMGKSVAINKANTILYKFARFLTFFNKKMDK